MSFIVNPFQVQAAGGGGGFSNTKSLSCSDVADTLTRTQGAGASRRKMTFSYWFRTTDAANAGFTLTDSNSGSDVIFGYDASNGSPSVVLGAGGNGAIITTGVSFSNNTWYHVVIQLDTANGTAGNRCKIFVNGTDRTSTLVSVTLNYDTGWGLNADTEHGPNEQSGVATTLVDEFSKIDNQVLGDSSFATSNLPIDISALTFGTQGYWLRFETATGTSEGTDSSGNGRTFTSTYDNADSSSTVP